MKRARRDGKQDQAGQASTRRGPSGQAGVEVVSLLSSSEDDKQRQDPDVEVPPIQMVAAAPQVTNKNSRRPNANVFVFADTSVGANAPH